MSNNKFSIILSSVFFLLLSFLVGHMLINNFSIINLNRGQILKRFEPISSFSEKTKIISVLSSETAISSILKGNQLRYVETDGMVFEIDIKTGTQRTVSDKTLTNILGVIWSPDMNTLAYLVNKADGNNFILLDIEQGVFKNLDYSIGVLAFSPDNDKLVYVLKDGEIGSVVIQYVASGEFKKIANIRFKVAALNWLINDELYIKSLLEDNDYTSFILTSSGALTKIIEKKINLEELPSRDGQKILLSSLAGGNIKTALFVQGKEVDLDLRVSINKCTWGNDNIRILCAINKGSSGQEELYAIDTQTKQKRFLSALPSYIIVEKLFISELDNYAIIQNSLDRKLYRVYLENI